jgi:peptide/nickel transport system ATP-binding protein
MLSVRDLCVSFRTEHGEALAIDHVSFDVEQGEILGVVGESGSGKTVSLLAVMGLINDPNARVTGSIKLRGQELVGMRPSSLRKLRGRDIAMIFQDPMTSMTPVYTIGEQIAEQMTTHQKISKRAALDRAVQLLAEVNIPKPDEAIHRFPHQLSGGMRQRAMIAMALSNNPSLLIADEPTTALDVTVQAQILDLVRRLQREHKAAVVFITHAMGVISEIADRVMVMYAGRIVESATKTEIFRHPQHPYTQALLETIPPLTGEKLKRLKVIPGMPPSLFKRGTGCAFAPRCLYRFESCANRPPLEGGAHAAACFKVHPHG